MAEIFHLTHDADDFSEYSTQPTGGAGDEIELSAASGLGGTPYGLEIDSEGNADFGERTFGGSSASGFARFGFRSQLNTLSILNGDEFEVMGLLNDTTAELVQINWINTGAGPRLLVLSNDDAGDFTFESSAALINSDTTFEIVITQASSDIASDGKVELYINGVFDSSATGRDNYDFFISYFSGVTARLFKIDPRDGTTTGVMYLDEIILRDDNTPIYPPDTASHIWLSTDGGATYSDIGDSANWLANLVGGVVVVPGTAYQTIFTAVGSNLYKTVDGGTNWTLEVAITYEVDFIDLEKDNTTVFLAKRDAGGNRASLWDSVGASLSHINTGKSTTGGSTAGGDVV